MRRKSTCIYGVLMYTNRPMALDLCMFDIFHVTNFKIMIPNIVLMPFLSYFNICRKKCPPIAQRNRNGLWHAIFFSIHSKIAVQCGFIFRLLLLFWHIGWNVYGQRRRFIHHTSVENWRMHCKHKFSQSCFVDYCKPWTVCIQMM